MDPETTIEEVEPRTASDDVLRDLHILEEAFELEHRPDRPSTPFSVFAAGQRSQPSYREQRVLLARRAGEPVVSTWIELDRTGDNDHVAAIFTYVRPDLRRQGLSRPMLDRALAVAEADKRTLALGFTVSTIPSGGEYAEGLGATVGLVERESELDLTTLDRELVARWVAEGPGRAPDYEMLMFDGPMPDELRPAMSQLYEASNDAPLDDLKVEDEHRTPEQLAEGERLRFEAGWERVLCLVRHRETGELGGWTELAHHPDEPWKVAQYWTAVDRKHRGHALGKWLKAANLARALERWPQATTVTTSNAYSNDAMLGINNQLGFRETLAWTAWQIEIDKLRARLG
jgi:mycothiol synthase